MISCMCPSAVPMTLPQLLTWGFLDENLSFCVVVTKDDIIDYP